MKRRDLFKFLGAGALAATVAKAAPVPEIKPPVQIPDGCDEVYIGNSEAMFMCSVSCATSPYPMKWDPLNFPPGEDYEDDY